MTEQDVDGRATCPHQDAVKWNPWNKVVQCHRCGQVFAPEDEVRKNELYLAMVTVEELGGASPEETAVIIALGKRLDYLKRLSGNVNVGYGLTSDRSTNVP